MSVLYNCNFYQEEYKVSKLARNRSISQFLRNFEWIEFLLTKSIAYQSKTASHKSKSPKIFNHFLTTTTQLSWLKQFSTTKTVKFDVYSKTRYTRSNYLLVLCLSLCSESRKDWNCGMVLVWCWLTFSSGAVFNDNEAKISRFPK